MIGRTSNESFIIEMISVGTVWTKKDLKDIFRLSETCYINKYFEMCLMFGLVPSETINSNQCGGFLILGLLKYREPKGL